MIVAIVPVKQLSRAKSRLADLLDAEQRAALVCGLFCRTLEVLRRCPEVGRTLVVSLDPEILRLAKRLGAEPVEERPPGELNSALEQATRRAASSGAGAVLILPADLPLLCVEDVCALTAHADGRPHVVLAPDHRRQGTNALLVAPPGLIEYSFGTASYRRHLHQARRVGADTAVCDLPGLALDIDLAEDLDLVRAGGPGSHLPDCRDLA